jgi:DcaP outer membrane protein
MKINYSNLRKGLSATALSCLTFAAFSQGAPVVTPATTPAKPAAAVVPAAAAATVPSIKLSGLIRNDLYFDTRQIVSARDGELVLWPTDVVKDASGNDLNAKSSFNMNPISSRIAVGIVAPDAFGAKATGLIEFEFFGGADAANGAGRLRHAFAKLDWGKTQLLVGQFWHPLFVTDCFPGTAAYNTAIPVNPFNRSPQIRLTTNLGNNVNLLLAAVTQREGFAGFGPLGQSATYAENTGIPALDAQVFYKTATVLAGVAVDYKVLRPYQFRAVGTPAVNTEVTSTVAATTLSAYLKFTSKDVVIKAQYTKGQNMADQTSVGGYLVYGTGAALTYKPTTTSGFWVELLGTGKKIVPGIVFAYLKNDGASDLGSVQSYGRAIGGTVNAAGNLGRGVDNLYQIMPRLEFKSGSWKFMPEICYEVAGWAAIGTDGKATGTIDKVSNTRLQFVTMLTF